MLTIDARPSVGILGTHARTKLVTLVKFSRTSESWPLSFTSRKSAWKPPPALFTSTSTRANAGDPFPHRVAVAHIEHADLRTPTGRVDCFCGATEPVGVSIAHGDVGAEVRTCRRDRGTDSLRRAGHDDEAVGQQHGIGRECHSGRRLASGL